MSAVSKRQGVLFVAVVAPVWNPSRKGKPDDKDISSFITANLFGDCSHLCWNFFGTDVHFPLLGRVLPR